MFVLNYGSHLVRTSAPHPGVFMDNLYDILLSPNVDEITMDFNRPEAVLLLEICLVLSDFGSSYRVLMCTIFSITVGLSPLDNEQ